MAGPGGKDFCVERGCTDWRKGVDGDITSLLDPEQGAVAGLHKKINENVTVLERSKVSWKVLTIIIGIAVAAIGGSFAYTTYATNKAEAMVKEVSARHEKASERLEGKIDRLMEVLADHKVKTERNGVK